MKDNPPQVFVNPQWIADMCAHNGKGQRERKVWQIGLETTLIPFFTATNATGTTAIPADALGAPIRLAYEKDGSVKFSPTGRPVTRVAKPITEQVRFMRDYFIATLDNHTEAVMKAKPAEYRKQVELAGKAGKPILTHDKQALDKAIQLQLEEAMRKAKAEEAEPVAEPEPEREAVTA